MKKLKAGSCSYYVDESGDPTFYDRSGNILLGKEGCSSHLILGFVQIPNPSHIRTSILKCQNDVLRNPEFQHISSLKKTAKTFHAKDDHSDVRHIFFECLLGLDFKSQFVVARKDEQIFQSIYKGNEQFYYDRLVALLFENVLHLHDNNAITFARRYDKERRDPLSVAIKQGTERFEQRCGVSVTASTDIIAQTPLGEPCLWIVDYMLWAVQRVFARNEWQYYEMVEDKVSMLRVLDDQWPSNRTWYNRSHRLSIEKSHPSGARPDDQAHGVKPHFAIRGMTSCTKIPDAS